jgi:hypothetical protein
MVGLADPPDQWRIAPGTDRVYVGTSERDTPLTATFEVSSP